ncbi:MAG: SCP2 sterol-binding domain-containing protein [Streptosporangiaceae bacterium]
MRRTAGKAPPGQGERFSFHRTDGPGTWIVQFDGDAVLLGTPDGDCDIQVSGTASDLALFLWQRASGKLDVQGDTSLLSRYFVLVPPM